eukprot:3168933-Pleurochrysis_carterae.AAC.3
MCVERARTFPTPSSARSRCVWLGSSAALASELTNFLPETFSVDACLAASVHACLAASVHACLAASVHACSAKAGMLRTDAALPSVWKSDLGFTTLTVTDTSLQKAC